MPAKYSESIIQKECQEFDKKRKNVLYLFNKLLGAFDCISSNVTSLDFEKCIVQVNDELKGFFNKNSDSASLISNILDFGSFSQNALVSLTTFINF